MKKFKYKISGDGDQDEIWVCEACKKAKNELILKGKWKLIERHNDAKIPCGVCGDSEVVIE